MFIHANLGIHYMINGMHIHSKQLSVQKVKDMSQNYSKSAHISGCKNAKIL